TQYGIKRPHDGILKRIMTAFAFLFTLAAIGMAETSYLIKQRRSGEHAVCVIGKGCSDVLESKYNQFFGLYNDVLGFIFYCVMAGISASVVIGLYSSALLSKLAFLALAGATLMTLRFIYLQWRVIRVWCFWCLMSALVIGLMDLIVILLDFDLISPR
ncbi:MAG: hypothetical protein NUV56_02605, partial [Candidatus Uhrbacteria bacterium]|nr:hypothetical protein [Candidatus Uhrbacteria bacterium]